MRRRAGRGKGRNRPWRWVPLGNQLELGGTPAERSAAEALIAVIEGRNVDRIRHYNARKATDPARLRQRVGIAALLAPLQRRTSTGEAPAGSRLVDVLSYLMPRPDHSSARTTRPPSSVGDAGQSDA